MMLNKAFQLAAGIVEKPVPPKPEKAPAVEVFESLADCHQLSSPRSYARRMARTVDNGLSLAENTYWLTQHAKRWAQMATGKDSGATPE